LTVKGELLDENEINPEAVKVEALLSGLQNQADVIKLVNYLGKITGKPIELDSLKLSDEERRKRIGSRIRMMRHGLEMKQVELAEKLGVSKGAIAAYEIGKSEPTLKNLIGLSRILGVTTDWLLGEAPLPQ